MKRFLAIPAALLAVGCLLAAEPADRPADKKYAPKYQAFVFFGDTRPLLIRLRVEIDGRPLEAAWGNFIDRLFKQLDVDGDGVLSEEEFDRMPSPQALFNNTPLRGLPNNLGCSSTAPPATANTSGRRRRVAEYYRRLGGGPFQTARAARATARSPFPSTGRRSSQAAGAPPPFPPTRSTTPSSICSTRTTTEKFR